MPGGERVVGMTSLNAGTDQCAMRDHCFRVAERRDRPQGGEALTDQWDPRRTAAQIASGELAGMGGARVGEGLTCQRDCVVDGWSSLSCF